MQSLQHLVLLLMITRTLGIRYIKCYSCNSRDNGNTVCGLRTSLTPLNTSYVVQCKGTCKIGTLSRGNYTAHMRICDNTHYVSGCASRPNGAVCHCTSDFCNAQWDDHPVHPNRPVSLQVVDGGGSNGCHSGSFSVTILLMVILNIFCLLQT